MKFFAAIAVLFAVAASALPATDLRARTITGPTIGYQCENQIFTAEYITRTINHAVHTKYVRDTPWAELPRCVNMKKKDYRGMDFCRPKAYKNLSGAHEGDNDSEMYFYFPNCPVGPWWEHPLMADHSMWDPPTFNAQPGNPNLARVIF
ncbi:hypothetical protein DXG01_008772 [Tephrocybe rancida]|nr:hypothetical protein DXG01_008772 [Tephrocybe rancida]